MWDYCQNGLSEFCRLQFCWIADWIPISQLFLNPPKIRLDCQTFAIVFCSRSGDRSCTQCMVICLWSILNHRGRLDICLNNISPGNCRENSLRRIDWMSFSENEFIEENSALYRHWQKSSITLVAVVFRPLVVVGPREKTDQSVAVPRAFHPWPGHCDLILISPEILTSLIFIILLYWYHVNCHTRLRFDINIIKQPQRVCSSEQNLKDSSLVLISNIKFVKHEHMFSIAHWNLILLNAYSCKCHTLEKVLNWSCHYPQFLIFF